MIDERELFGLADRALGRPPRPVEDVIERGARRRRRRTRFRAATSVAVVATITVTATWIVQRSSEKGSETLVAAGIDATTGVVLIDGSECSGFARAVEAEQAAGLRYLPSYVPEGWALTNAWARVETDSGSCEGPPAAVLSEPRLDGRPRSVIMYGPSAGPLDLDTLDDGDGGAEIRPTTVNGRPARIVQRHDPLGDSLFTVFWNERDGQFWQATGTGVSQQQLLAFLDEVRIASTGALELGAPVEGLAVTWQRSDPMGDVLAETRWWHASFDRASRPGSGQLSLSVREDPHFRLEELMARGAQPITVGEHAGALFDNGGRSWFLFWLERPGVVGELSGPVDPATLVRIAESVEPIDAGDPRIGE